MPIEYVSKMVVFDNLLVECSAHRYICDKCGKRECFHDVPTPYGERVPSPTGQGWSLTYTVDDDEGCLCRDCRDDRWSGR